MFIDLMRDTSKSFPKIDNAGKATKLRVWHCRYDSLSDITAFSNVTDLAIATVPDNNLSFLEPLVKLKKLKLLHFPKITHLESLGALEELESLSLASSSICEASGQSIEVDSFWPLSGLKKLKHIEILNVLPREDGLIPLYNLPVLKSAHLSKFSDEELKEFYTYRDTARCLEAYYNTA